GQPILPRHQIKVVRFGVRRAALLERPLFFRQELELERTYDGFRNLILDRENVGQIAIVALGPQMIAGRTVDQLRSDAHATAGLAHTALKNMADPELPPDVAHVHRLALEREGGI